MSKSGIEFWRLTRIGEDSDGDIIRTELGIFIANEKLTAYGRLCEFINEMAPDKRWLGGGLGSPTVYPRYEIERGELR